MSIEVGQDTFTTIDRTYRTVLFTEKGADPVLLFAREKLLIDSKGEVAKVEQGIETKRQFSAIKDDTFEAAGVKITAAQLAALISAASDIYRAQDIKALEEQAASEG